MDHVRFSLNVDMFYRVGSDSQKADNEDDDESGGSSRNGVVKMNGSNDACE